MNARTKSQVETTRAEPPATHDLQTLASAVQECRACPLWEHATQAVFGLGVPSARIVMIGEQPGDQEDKVGRPFVGPAGRILKAAMGLAGLAESDVFITNAVKHFKWEQSHNRRLHKRPTYREVLACYPWLEAEIDSVDPELLVCLGATAAQSLLGPDFRLTVNRGRILDGLGGRKLIATIHPSFVLRQRRDEDRDAQMRVLIGDLETARDFLNGG